MVPITIRSASAADWAGLWPIIQSVARAGDSYPYPADIAEAEARPLWMAPPVTTHVAVTDGGIAGSYYLKPNQMGRGAHVANAGYMVDSARRGAGLGRLLGEHSLTTAAAMGYAAMQFNLVVGTNTPAVKLWKSLGFDIVGTLPEAFRHATLGLVHAYVMYRRL